MFVDIEKEMEIEFTNANARRKHARKVRKAAESARIISDANIPGALWIDTPKYRTHLAGIPYSYYDDEIVMLRQHTVELVKRQRAEARARARATAQGRRQAPEGGHWYIIDEGVVRRESTSETSKWQGIDE